MTFKLFRNTNKNEETVFFDFPASERKKIIKKAARMSNELQIALVRDYRESLNK